MGVGTCEGRRRLGVPVLCLGSYLLQSHGSNSQGQKRLPRGVRKVGMLIFQGPSPPELGAPQPCSGAHPQFHHPQPSRNWIDVS